MRIVAEYDKDAIHGNGCGGLEAAGKMYVNSGGGTMANLREFDVYAFPLHKFWKLAQAERRPTRRRRSSCSASTSTSTPTPTGRR